MTARTVQGRHVLAGLVAFFGVMMLANAIFVYFAVVTFSGGDTSKPYQKGLNYNQTIQADDLQAERGWQTEIEYRRGTLTLRFADSAGAAVTGLDVAVELARPTTDKDDRRLILKEVSEGRYSAAIALPQGLWVVSAASRHKDEGGETAYRLKRRLHVAGAP
ncbi:MAG TPA: FixH family protein [Methyloceanibacter sp.]|nr:FixH family protein [Methyloceanibacter sp.]